MRGAAVSRALTALELLRQSERVAALHERARQEHRAERDGVAHGAEIARTATPKRKPRQRAGQIGRGLQLVAQIAAEPRLVGEIGDRIEPGIERGRHRSADCRAGSPSSRAPAAGHGAVDGGEQAPCARALVRAHQLEIGARRGIDDEEAAGSSLARRAEQRRPADLSDLHIGEQAGKRGKLGSRELAEGIERCDAETRLQRPLAARQNRNERAGIGVSAAPRFLDRGGASAASPARSSPMKNLAGPEARKLARTDRSRPTVEATARRSKYRARRARRAGSPPSLAGAAEQRGEEIMGAGVEQALLGEGARA